MYLSLPGYKGISGTGKYFMNITVFIYFLVVTLNAAFVSFFKGILCCIFVV